MYFGDKMLSGPYWTDVLGAAALGLGGAAGAGAVAGLTGATGWGAVAVKAGVKVGLGALEFYLGSHAAKKNYRKLDSALKVGSIATIASIGEDIAGEICSMPFAAPVMPNVMGQATTLQTYNSVVENLGASVGSDAHDKIAAFIAGQQQKQQSAPAAPQITYQQVPASKAAMNPGTLFNK